MLKIITSDIVPRPLITGKKTPSVKGVVVHSIMIFVGSVLAYPEPPSKTSTLTTPYTELKDGLSRAPDPGVTLVDIYSSSSNNVNRTAAIDSGNTSTITHYTKG